MEVELAVEMDCCLETYQILGPRPSGTPPGALTTFGLHAVKGDSSSAVLGLIRWPLTHLAPDRVRLHALPLHYPTRPGALHSLMECP